MRRRRNPSAMRGALAQEWVRLRTIRSTWLLSAGSLAVTVLAAVAYALTAGSTTAGRTAAGSGPAASGVLGDQAAFAQVLSAAAQLTPLLMGLLGVFAFGHEYRHGTIRPTLTTVPRRPAVAVAKLLITTLWAAAVAMVCVGASAVVLVVLRGGRFAAGVGFDDWPTQRVALGTALYVILIALLGLGFGWLFRNIPAAVSLLFVLPLVVEPILRAVLSIKALHSIAGIGRYLPFGAGGQLYAYSTRVDPRVPAAFRNDLSPLAGGLTLAAVTAVLLVVAYVLFQRRDA
jgi:ABC-2 type transport system permease protein